MTQQEIISRIIVLESIVTEAVSKGHQAHTQDEYQPYREELKVLREKINLNKKIIGIVKIIKSAFIDPTDKEKKFVAVKVAYYKDLVEPVSLANIKENNEISHLPLIKQSRLSVMPIDSKSWKIICKMGRI